MSPTSAPTLPHADVELFHQIDAFLIVDHGGAPTLPVRIPVGTTVGADGNETVDKFRGDVPA